MSEITSRLDRFWSDLRYGLSSPYKRVGPARDPVELTGTYISLMAQNEGAIKDGQARREAIIGALARIQDAVGKYTDPGHPMTADEFINVVLSAADDQEVVRAMRGLRE